MERNEKFLTIFTPMFNRSEMIPRLFSSLDSQISKNFEWIIIDDGSTENIDKIIEKELKKNHHFPITFIKTKNGGKQRAINRAVKISKGQYFFILDNDDLLLPTTTKDIFNWCNDLKNDEHFENFAGVSGLRVTPSGDYLSGLGNGEKVIDATNIERRKYNLLGDMAEVYKTSVLRKYPFPVFKGENFISEAIVWNRIAADGYKIRWHMDPIYIAEYRADGLTRNSLVRDANNYKGLTFFTKQCLELLSFREKMNIVSYYIKVSNLKGIKAKEISKQLNLSLVKIIMVKLISKIRNK